MHWTLIVLIALCGLCVLLNAALWLHSRRACPAGLLVCAGWMVQQTYWWTTGTDSLALFIVCDTTIIGWFLWKRRAFNIGERLIASTIPLTTGLGTYAWLAGGHSTETWWANWWLVAGQMVIGLSLPIPRLWARARHVPYRSSDIFKHFDIRASAWFPRLRL